ncbi:MAG: hypothetical protein QXE81_04600, partial [Desulfurococcaceae archaeon]
MSTSTISKYRPILIILILIVILVAALAVYYYPIAPTTSPSPTPETSPTTPLQKVRVKIGLIFPLSGAFAQFGQDTLNGALAALEMFKQKQILPAV